MRLGKWDFRPGLWPTLAMLVLVPLFIALGVWQWHRAGYKQALIAAYAEQTARPPVALEAVLSDSTLDSLPRYLHLRAIGAYDGAHQLLLQDMTHDGEVGYQVLTPFVLSQGDIVLVDRGWVPADPHTGAAPAVDVGGDTRALDGILDELPVPGIKLGTPAPAGTGWPKTLFYPSLDDLKPLFGPKFLGLVVRLGAGQPDGYVREFSPAVGFPPERHQAYALQWWVLALAVFIVWLVVNLRRGRVQA